MTEPWFDPNAYAWIPGTLVGVIGGLLGGLAGMLAPRGLARGFILGSFMFMMVVSVALLGTALYAAAQGQPWGIWYGIGLPGVIGLIVFGVLYPIIKNVYQQAEARRLHAKDMSAAQ